MLHPLPEKLDLIPIIEQVNHLGNFGKRLELNEQTGTFFNDPWKTKKEFEETPLGKALALLGPIGQARLLRLSSCETYTAHYDPDDRIHLVIDTNPYSYLVDITNVKLYHLEADGQLWHMDTGKLHVAANWGPSDRIHLNVRVLLPKFDISKSYIHIKITDEKYDWKQQSYLSLMGFANKMIKARYITGFHSPNERELLLNIMNKVMFDPVLKELSDKGIEYEVTYNQ